MFQYLPNALVEAVVSALLPLGTLLVICLRERVQGLIDERQGGEPSLDKKCFRCPRYDEVMLGYEHIIHRKPLARR